MIFYSRRWFMVALRAPSQGIEPAKKANGGFSPVLRRFHAMWYAAALG